MADVPLMNNPMTAAGDIIQGGASGAPSRLAIGTAGQILKVNSGATALEYGDAPAGVSGSLTGNVLIAAPQGISFDSANTQQPNGDVGYALPIRIPGNMSLRSCVFFVSAGGTGTVQWGLFDYSSNAAAATKLAGGSAALNSTGAVAIVATGAPISIDPGNYMLIFKTPSANVPTLHKSTAPGASQLNKNQTSYVWDDTPDLTSGWMDQNLGWMVYLLGDLDGANAW